VHILAPLIMLFLLGNTIVGANNAFNMLMTDLYAYRPAKAMVGMHMYKFLCGVGATSEDYKDWMVGAVIAGLWVSSSPGL